MGIVLIVSGALIILTLVWNIWGDESVVSALLIIVSTFTFAVCLDEYCNEYCNRDEPIAIDVYRGKTVLEITYIDSVPIDTVVVYKPEYKK